MKNIRLRTSWFASRGERSFARTFAPLLFALLAVSLLLPTQSCNGGGKKDDGGGGGGTVTIRDIILNPANPGASALVSVTLDAVSTSTPIADRTKVYTVSKGTLYDTEPDFSLVMRGTAQASGATTLTTKQSHVYWITPAATGEVTVSARVDQASRERKVVIGNALASLSVSADEQGRKIVTVTANDVTDLFQAAFRVNYKSSKYQVVSVEKGDFLGADALFIGEKDKTPGGVVAVSISRKLGQTGVEGSGILARIVFAEKTASAIGAGDGDAEAGKSTDADRDASLTAAFALDYITLLDSNGSEMGR
jgi:hypothetical protein